MAKFLPIIGEAYTAVESGILIASAGVAKVFGNDEAASELADSAGKSWREYSETNVLAAPINAIIHDSKGDHKKAKEITDSYLNAASSCVDSIPVVGHAKGLIHYAMGDVQKGHKSMEALHGSIGLTCPVKMNSNELVSGIIGIAGEGGIGAGGKNIRRSINRQGTSRHVAVAGLPSAMNDDDDETDSD